MTTRSWLVVDQQNLTACTQMLIRRHKSRKTCPYDQRIDIAIGLVVACFIGKFRQCADAGKAACSKSIRHFNDSGRKHRFLCT